MYDKVAWNYYDVKANKELTKLGEEYKYFLDHAKNERFAVKEAKRILEEHGFKPLESFKELKRGDKVYAINKFKNVAAFVIGKKPISDGIHILGAHIDSPRLDLKPNPLYEDDGFALFDTHYYGGIKKYQWTTIPLALMGVVCKKDGSKVEINIGNDPKDPIFIISDLLIHLADAQLRLNLENAIKGENLDVTIGSIPLKGEKGEAIKRNILRILKDKYNFDEEDFVSAEIEVVPAFPSRDLGLDRSMIAGYGHDDRCCAFPSLMAIVDVNPKEVEYTSCVILTDKEEVGSIGATGAHSFFIENVVAELVYLRGERHPTLNTRRAFGNSMMISSDVTAGADPLYKYASSPHNNMAYLGRGICFNKYTGRGGKKGGNDAMPEYIAYLRDLIDKNNICYQISELGGIDVGGGGTISYILAKYNMLVLDAGIPLLNMHAPMEVLSKADLYETYKFYKTFLMAK